LVYDLDVKQQTAGDDGIVDYRRCGGGGGGEDGDAVARMRRSAAKASLE